MYKRNDSARAGHARRLHGRTAKSLWYSQLLNNLDVGRRETEASVSVKILTGNGRSQSQPAAIACNLAWMVELHAFLTGQLLSQ